MKLIYDFHYLNLRLSISVNYALVVLIYLKQMIIFTRLSCLLNY